MRHYQRLTGDVPPAAQSTAAEESSTTIASLGALQTYAQSVPLAPSLPAVALTPSESHHAYHRQATDYIALVDDDATTHDS